MEAMTLEQSAYIGEILAAIAVIVSLIYVGIGVRHNARATEAGTVHSIVETWGAFDSALAQNADLTRIWFDGLLDPANLEEVAGRRFVALMHSAGRLFQNIYYQHHQGNLPEHIWTGLEYFQGQILQSPGGRRYWELRKGIYGRDFQDYVDNEIMLGEPRVFPAWKDYVGE